MNEISKVSDITYTDIADYLRLPGTATAEQNLLKNLLSIAKNFICQYTGRTLTELDNYQDFVIVVFILCQDMYDNRVLYVNTDNLNKVVTTILGMHAINNLPSVVL